MSELGLNALQHETLIELLNISVGAAANVLSQMAHSEIKLTVPKLFQISRKEVYSLVQETTEDKIVSINMEVEGVSLVKACCCFRSVTASHWSKPS
ncbi:MAG TPA: hypothetical protein HPP65_01280 [Gammaproteobacteria bacterium]|mgnify:CR=1 FL=1|jgi:chemotaxis protein CheY-P-specific phosphatase CheC|nr:hypothetical protein [Gammaproteobacteria bacterium]MBT3489491.1 hypothetical protein [Gammaproteobacteria bacterium]MBT3717871.1 hypothetical protein [Gammaproteobacteria bacterium]MBT4300538.1 hypothetical protein [Gammaproteobacteria bacterium]MBT5372706.1 hypothetical protein [Gammaproteobacteria bacterium]